MINMNPLERVLSSKARAEVFRLLFDEPIELYMRDIERKTGLLIGSIQQVLRDLLELDLVVARKDGNRLYYSANRQHPLYPDLHNLVVKTVGTIGILSSALNENGIKCAFIFGSVARGEEKAQSDIDLFIIGDVGLRRVSELLSDAQKRLAREINLHVMTEKEFLKRKKEKDHFLTNVLKNKKIFVKGGDNELKAMGR